MSIYTPYFYIIQHKTSKKLYAGCRFAKKCNPRELLSDNGYLTSSKEIQKIIHIEGKNAFEILRIDTFCDGLHVYEYETLFLEATRCAQNANWFNCHNNQRKTSLNLEKLNNNRKSAVMNKYNVDNISQLSDTKNKVKQTMLNKYGKHYTQTEEYKRKTTTTNLIKYGTESHNAVEKVKNKVKQTMLNKYGVINYGQLETQKEKLRNRNAQFHVCSNCFKIGQSDTMKRYHFNNCNQNINENFIAYIAMCVIFYNLITVNNFSSTFFNAQNESVV